MITIPGVDPDMIANNIIPSNPSHPGEFIKDELECRKLTQARLAESIGVKPSIINEIIKGKRGINVEIALLLEAALDIPANFLLNLQTLYNMQSIKANPTFMERLSAVRKIAML